MAKWEPLFFIYTILLLNVPYAIVWASGTTLCLNRFNLFIDLNWQNRTIVYFQKKHTIFSMALFFSVDSISFWLGSVFSPPWRRLLSFGWQLALSPCLFQHWDSGVLWNLSLSSYNSFHYSKATLVFLSQRRMGLLCEFQS